MIKNRFFKTTLGLFAQIAVVAAVDASDGAALPESPAVISVPVTIAGSPTATDTIDITVNGQTYRYTVPVSGTTQQAHDGILAILEANTQGFIITSHSGTTSSVFNLAWSGGATNNGKTVSLVEGGSTFTVAGPYTFAGGVDADAGAADTMEAFVTSGDAGSIWAFWEDTKKALVAGDTFNPANIGRKFFYAWKQGTVTHISTPIPVRSRVYDFKSYSAGTAEVWTIGILGTMAATQIVHLTIVETTATLIPYPRWTYDINWITDNATTAAAVIAAVNAETDPDKFIVASGSSTNVILTSQDKTRTFKVTVFLEVSPTQPTDQSAFTQTHTAKSAAPIGDLATVREIENYGKENAGAIVYAPEGTRAEEFQTFASNIGAITGFGLLLVTATTYEAGVVRDYSGKPAILIAIADGGQATLAAL